MSMFGTSRPELTLGTLRYGFPLFPAKLVLRGSELRTHSHQIGLTGVGKSRLNESRFLQLLSQNIGVSLLDPHSDSAENVLRNLVADGFFEDERAYERVLYVEFADPEQQRFVPFNVLKQSHLRPHEIAASTLEAFHRAWPSLSDGSAPIFDNLILSGTLVLVENGLPITAMHRLLTDQAFRERLLESVSDPDVVAFFRQRFDRWGGGGPTQLVESSLRRIFLLTFAPVLKYSLGQAEENALDFREIMDCSQAVIYDLGKVRDPFARRLLGCLITAGYEQAALSREDTDPSSRPIHHLVIDEFAEFSAQSGEALARMLAQTRKYDLVLSLSSQTWNQASRDLQPALQNVGVRIGFRLGREDAERLAKVFGDVEPRQTGDSGATESVRSQWEDWATSLTELPAREALVKVDGKRAVQVKTPRVPTPAVDSRELEAVKERYRSLLMRPRPAAHKVSQAAGPMRPLSRLAPLDTSGHARVGEESR